MTTEVEITDEHEAGLFDSATGETLKTERVFDITDDCPSGERILLLFTRAKRGRIVQITHPIGEHAYMGSHTHFFVDELEGEMRAAPRDDTFGLWAERCGMDKAVLRQIIESLSPS